MVQRSAKVTITKRIPRIGTPDSTTIIFELRESFVLYEYSALRTKPKPFLAPSKIPPCMSVLGHVNSGEEPQRGT